MAKTANKTNKNKVNFGFSETYVSKWNETENKPKGTPIQIPGAVNLSIEDVSEELNFYADNGVYYTEMSSTHKTGELEMAKFPDWFLINHLGYRRTTKGTLVEVKNAKQKPFCLLFSVSGDKQEIRHVLYNVSAGQIKKEYKTIAGGKEVITEKLPVTILGDPKTGVFTARYTPDDEEYKTLTTAEFPAITLADEKDENEDGTTVEAGVGA